MDGNAGAVPPPPPLPPEIVHGSQIADIQARVKVEPDFSARLQSLVVNMGNKLPSGATELMTSIRGRPPVEGPPRSRSTGQEKSANGPPPVSPRSPRAHKFKHCASRGVRHTYQHHLKDISTPDWLAKPGERITNNTDIGDIDIVVLHGLLEVYESRILGGGDIINQHPILARKAMQEDQGHVLSKAEYDRTRRYAARPVIEKTPRFWPGRPWDCPDSVMAPEDTAKLAEILRDGEQALMFGLGPTLGKGGQPVRRSPTAERTKRPLRASIVVLSGACAATDSDDTDLGDM